MKRSRHIEVELTLLPTEHGGRSKPAFNDYSPQFYYAGHDWDARHEYPDTARVDPGDTVRGYLYFLSPEQHVGQVRPGMAFLIREGQRIVGYGAVVRLIDFELSVEKASVSDDSAG